MTELKAKEGCCEEASPMSAQFYIPCNRPAVALVGWKGRDEKPIRMCDQCEYHNVKNRGGYRVEEIRAKEVQAQTQPTHADCIGQYIKLRNFIAARQEAFDAEMKPYHDAMKALEDWGAGILNSLAGDDDAKASLATTQGTMYRKKTLSLKVADREKWFEFVFSDFDHARYLTAAVSKDEVQQYMEKFQCAPPGIETTWVRKTLFNSPKK